MTAIAAGDKVHVKLTHIDGSETILGAYTVPQASGCLDHDGPGRTMDEDIMHALASSEGQPASKQIVKVRITHEDS